MGPSDFRQNLVLACTVLRVHLIFYLAFILDSFINRFLEPNKIRFNASCLVVYIGKTQIKTTVRYKSSS